MKPILFSILVVIGLLAFTFDAFDKPIYMLHYTGLDTIPVAYGSCMPLKVDGYPASMVLIEALSHCTAYSDQNCQAALTPTIAVGSGWTGLEVLGEAFSMENFMVCTLDGYNERQTNGNKR